MTAPLCCRFGLSEEGFVHWWLNHADPSAKQSARNAAKGLDIMRRWVQAAEAAEKR